LIFTKRWALAYNNGVEERSSQPESLAAAVAAMTTLNREPPSRCRRLTKKPAARNDPRCHRRYGLQPSRHAREMALVIRRTR